MVVPSLVMAACLSVIMLAVLPGRMPAPHGHGKAGVARIAVEWVLVIIFSLAGSFGFNLLAMQGGG